MNKRSLHAGTIMPPRSRGLGASNLAQFLHLAADFLVDQDQGLEIVGGDPGPGNGSKDLAKPSHNTLFGQAGSVAD